MVHVGCSEWSYTDWRGVLYLPGLRTSRWLARYAERFDTVKLNTTSTGWPSPRTSPAGSSRRRRTSSSPRR